MKKLDLEMIRQKVSLYEHLVNNCLVTQNIVNFNRFKEELFQDLIKLTKEIDIKDRIRRLKGG